MIRTVRRHRVSRVRSAVMATLGQTPRQNYERFVEAGRLSDAFGDIVFDDTIWKVPTRTNLPGGSAVGELAFTVHSTSIDPGGRALDKRFGDFLKTVVRLDHAKKPSHINKHRRTIAVARMLHEASSDVGHDPCLFSTSTFKRALDISRTRRTEAGAPYEVGVNLQKFGKIMTDAGITPHRIDFRNTAPRPRDVRSDDGEDRRMPAEGALAALAKASQLVTTPKDVLRMRIVELLTCAPWRINDILRLPVDCEVFEPATRNGRPVLDADGNQVVRYGIGYSGSKGFVADIKWIPTAMVDVARRAIRQIRELTADARTVAKWMEANPGRAWLAEPYRLSPPDRVLNREELREALGLPAVKLVAPLARRFGIPRSPCSTERKWRYRVGDVEAALLRQHQPIQGDAPMERSEYLLLVQRNCFSSARETIASIVEVVDYGHVTDFLQSRPGVQSVFERFDLRDADGRHYVLKTHQVRHFVNTVAAEGGLGEIERAKWSGRTDIQTNAAYDHEPGYKLAEKARALLAQGKMQGPVADTYAGLPPVERSAFSLVHLATIHTTEIGLCVHDWATAPCPHHGACADCRDCAIIKGDPVHRERIEVLLEDEVTLIARATAEMDDGTYGASNYLEHHRRMAAGYRRMLATHDDASIEDGTLVQIDPEPARRGLLEEAELLS
jgi:hypothetical protein